MNVMNAMMMSCVKATSLMELKEQVPLSFIKNMQLRIHIMLCSGCRNYMKQSKIIDELLDKKFSSVVATENTSELETSIIGKLEL